MFSFPSSPSHPHSHPVQNRNLKIPGSPKSHICSCLTISIPLCLCSATISFIKTVIKHRLSSLLFLRHDLTGWQDSRNNLVSLILWQSQDNVFNFYIWDQVLLYFFMIVTWVCMIVIVTSLQCTSRFVTLTPLRILVFRRQRFTLVASKTSSLPSFANIACQETCDTITFVTDTPTP